MLFLLGTAVLGLLFSSFANVLVYRIPRGESIVWPGSRCPHCANSLAWFDNVPLLSWLLLGGRCRYCHESISGRYPLLELLMAVSWTYLAWYIGPQWLLAEALALFFLLWVLSFIDLETGLLPDALTYPGMILGLMFAVPTGHAADSLLGLCAGYGVFWLVGRVFLMLTGKEGMGHGDYKLLAMLGAFMGWQALPFIVFVSSFVGAIAGSIILLLSRRGLRAEIPFGPYLALAGMIWFLWHEPVLAWYLDLMAPVQ